MDLNQLTSIFSRIQGKKLSGGITGTNLKITDNGSGELTLSGDINITIKILDLTTSGTDRLTSLISFTQQTIANKLKGGAYATGYQYFKYNSAKNIFTNKPTSYSIRYNFNYMVTLTKISGQNELFGNDFVIAVVDDIGYQRSMYGVGGLTDRESGPAVVKYSSWARDPYIAVHEFFHTLGLDDLEQSSLKNRLMYHLNDRAGTAVTNLEREDMNRYLMHNINDMTRGSYSNASLNTVNKLRNFLNNPTNGFKYNKARFR